MLRTKSQIEKLPPEPKLNKALQVIVLSAAPLAQNPLLYEATPIDFLAIKFLLAKN
jgi:hypothetical protein